MVRTHSRRLAETAMVVVAIAIGTLLFAWPSFVNGGPFFLADTTAYLRSADAVSSTVFGTTTQWSDKLDLYVDHAVADAPVEQMDRDDLIVEKRAPLLGRSVYFGLVLFAPTVLLTERSLPILQGLFVSVLLWALLGPMLRQNTPLDRCARFAALCAALAFFTPLAFQTSLAMPDYLSGLGAIGLVSLIAFWRRYNKLEILVLSSVVLFSVVSHSSNILLIAIISIAGFLLLLLKQGVSRKAVALGFVMCIFAIISELVFLKVVEQQIGVEPIRPPFLTARLIDDGPGNLLITERCGEVDFTVCDFADRTPLPSNAFLWHPDESEGVFSAADEEVRRKLSAEDARFALATFVSFPIETIGSSFRAFARQLTLFRFTLFKRIGHSQNLSPNYPAEVQTRMAGTLNFQGTMPVEFVQLSSIIGTIISLPVLLGILVLNHRSKRPDLRALSYWIFLVLIAVLANAAIAGALSIPEARYTLRIIWVIPFAAVVSAYCVLRLRPFVTDRDGAPACRVSNAP